MKVGHLARRFAGSLWPAGPSGASEAWVAEVLAPGELELWRRMSAPDRRHAAGVARRVQESLRDAGPPILAAALLHDVGKIESGLGTLGRVWATLAGAASRQARDGRGRVGRYLRHDQMGAALLTAAGSDPLTVAWAREHHQPASAWSVPPAIGVALKSADDD